MTLYTVREIQPGGLLGEVLTATYDIDEAYAVKRLSTWQGMDVELIEDNGE